MRVQLVLMKRHRTEGHDLREGGGSGVGSNFSKDSILYGEDGKGAMDTEQLEPKETYGHLGQIRVSLVLTSTEPTKYRIFFS
jgi:hypothetical protein